jgi:hypothetical protein
MYKRLATIAAYLALLILSLPVPLLHQRLTDRAIESRRPAMKLSDGTVVGGLMPVNILSLRYLGRFSWIVVCGVALLLALSFKLEALARFEAICFVAIGQCAFTTMYAVQAALLLVDCWLYHLA